MEKIKLWKIENDSVIKINTEVLDFENRLEKWLIEDISILNPDLAVIGSQVMTPQGKKLDILAMNSLGELVIIELKRDKTYREVVAQILDYATWIRHLGLNDLTEILNNYGASGFNDIEEFFSTKFKRPSEGIEFNSVHHMIIVGSDIDDSTVRIIKYLSNEPFYVNINAVNFNYYKDSNGNEFLAQAFIEPEDDPVTESINKNRKRARSIIATLFDQEKLKIGQSVFFKPAIDNGIEKDKAKAIIVNNNQACLQRDGDNALYTFSGLRYVLAEEFNLTEVRKNWGFGVRYDWIDENGKTLSELADE